MADKIIKYYSEAWFKVEYDIDDCHTNFKAWRIQALDEENPEQSTISRETPNITGYIKWDGCMNFTQKDHYCGLYHAEQMLLLMQEIYKFNETLHPYD